MSRGLLALALCLFTPLAGVLLPAQTPPTNFDVAVLHAGDTLLGYDEAGVATFGLPPGAAGAGSYGAAIDGLRRTWFTLDGGQVGVFDPATGALQTFPTPLGGRGPLAIDGQGNVFVGGMLAPFGGFAIVVLDPNGNVINQWTTAGMPRRMTFDSFGRLGVLEANPFAGTIGVFNDAHVYDPANGTDLAMLAVGRPDAGLWARPGGGFVITQVTAPIPGYTGASSDAVVFTDQLLNPISAFSTAVSGPPPLALPPIGLPCEAAEGFDGTLYTVHPGQPFAFPPQPPVVRAWSPSGVPLAERPLPFREDFMGTGLTLDGKGQVLVPIGDNTRVALPVSRRYVKLARDLEPLFDVVLGTAPSFMISHNFGDPTGLVRCWIVDPGGDLDGDARSNASEIVNGTDPLDPLSFPVALVLGAPPAQGASFTVTYTAPEDALKARFFYWTANGAATRLASANPADWRVIEGSAAAASDPLALDPVFALALTPGNPFVAPLAGILDATGSGVMTVNVPVLPALSGLSLYGGLVVLDPAFSLGVKTISNRFRLVLP